MNFKPYKSCMMRVKQNINLSLAIFADFWAFNMFFKHIYSKYAEGEL